MKTILVLEGGALRGIYTAGVLDALMDNRIKVDAVVGVSAGALFGINYVSNQRGRCLRYNLDNIHNKNYMGYYSFITTGNVMNEDFCFNKLVYETDPFDFKTFNNSKIKFYAVVTNLETGKPEYIEIKDAEKDMDYLKASGSMPLLSKTVRINNKLYLDGGISDSIPIKWALKEGYDKIIVVETRHESYVKKKTAVWPFKLRYRKYKEFINTISNRYKDYNETTKYIKDKEKTRKIFVIRPSKYIKIKHIEKNKNKIKNMYDLGYNDTDNRISLLKDYLNK